MSHVNTCVVVVARQSIAREGIRRILADSGFRVIATSAEHVDVKDPRFEIPDLIVVEAETADEGIGIAGKLRLAMPDVRLVLITPQCDLTSVSRAIASGVDGYLTNSIPCEAMVGALDLVLLGEKIVPSYIVSELVNSSFASRPRTWDPINANTRLSDRETEVLQHLVLGEANKVVSRHFSISEATVKVHIKAILRKLHVLNRTQAAIWAIHNGITTAANDLRIAA